MTIGGNDLGFASIMGTCVAASATGPNFLHPTFTSCMAYFASPAGSADNPYARLAGVGAKVRAALTAVHRAAPHARILVIAYPAIAPNARNTPLVGCFAANSIPPTPVNGAQLRSAFPFTDTDVPFLARLQKRLDGEIAEATRDSGGRYADIYRVAAALGLLARKYPLGGARGARRWRVQRAAPLAGRRRRDGRDARAESHLPAHRN